MAKFIIRIERQDKLIDEAFDKMELHGFRKAQARVFKAVYKSRLKGFYHTIRTALSKYRAQDGKHFFEAEMEGEVDFRKRSLSLLYMEVSKCLKTKMNIRNLIPIELFREPEYSL